MSASDSAAAAAPPRPPSIVIEPPTIDDGVELWRMARDSRVLDLNSRYSYLLWCRDFAATSVIARLGPERVPAGFITGYRRPDEPGTLLVWQVAVDAAARGQGLAGRMLDALWAQVDGVDHMETTVTPDNEASIAMFAGFAQRHDAHVDVAELFSGAQLSAGEPDDDGSDHEPEHQPENRYRIGPIKATARTS
ncbi:MAG TPA: diaminobutyrate acetyltransferase [Pseudonocardia sp.]